MKSGHRLRAALLGAAVVLGLSGQDARAAFPTYLHLTGGAQGVIRGGVTQQGYENQIEVEEAHHLMRRDPGTGRLVHEPFIFLKRIDRSSVNLYRAMDTQEPLTAVFRYLEQDQSGQIINHYTVTLLNAVIVAIEPIKPDLFDPTIATTPDRERVRMIYGRIRVEFPSDAGETYEIIAN